MQTKKFQKKTEDFICEKCGENVLGSGFTDHCPNCLWGKHVDVNPGDRAANCGGAMKPISVELKSGSYILYYRCEKCGHKYKVKSAENDSVDKIIEISTN